MIKLDQTYEKNIQAEKEGSMKASPTANIGDREVLTITCKTCQGILFQMVHHIGDGIVTKINVDTFRFKAYCRPCLDSILKPLSE